MCGIFGFTGESSWKTSMLLQSLCIADEVRGRHSTGLVIQSNDNCFLSKKALKGYEFVAHGHTSFLFNKRYGNALGHNRLATAGAVTNRNAHPFGVKAIDGWNFGVHNGKVANKRRVAQEFGVKEPSVDSEVVFRAIANMQKKEIDITTAIEKITKFISPDADFAFAYLDTADKSIYLWRSSTRPLWIFDARELNLGRWFCSTRDIFADGWNSIRGPLGSIKKVTCFDIKPYRLYKITDDSIYDVDAVKDLKHRSWQAEEYKHSNILKKFNF